jgi:sulfite reductase (NADPH) hemoprotein beta-component
MTDTKEPSRNERIKEASQYLRGTLAEGLREEITGAIIEDDAQLVKFHGMYLQDDRDLRAERGKKKMEKAFAFMIRLRIPGGICSPEQFLRVQNIAQNYGNHTMRLTTRQTFQLHGIIKSNLKATMREIDKALLTTIAACGDVNRNVICNNNPMQSAAHAQVYATTRAISDHLLPQTPAWREIWLDGEKIVGGEEEVVEPIYGKFYLPRKFKVAIAVPPSNDIDVFAHDLGFIAIRDDNGDVEGYNVTVGGGMGMTHGQPKTYPRIGDVIGFCKYDEAVRIAEAVVTVQRDWGDRSDRSHARLKYTVEDHGLDNFRAEVEKRSGIKLGAPRPYTFDGNGDQYGWTDGVDGNGHLTLFVQNGRIRDIPGGPQWMTGLRKIAEVHKGEFRLTANQNIIISGVPPEQRWDIDKLVAQYKLTRDASPVRKNSMACVALPTCGLALAESERYLPDLITELEERLASHGLSDTEIVIRMTGCPNGCARPYVAEIALVGKNPGKYNLYLGGAFDGSRMGKLYAEDLDHKGIVDTLDPIFAAYRAERQDGEHFGDYTIRAGFVAPTSNGADFHANTGARRTA